MKIKLGLAAALVIGLSGCNMMMGGHNDDYSAQDPSMHHGKMSQHPDMNHQDHSNAQKMTAKASKEPAQKVTPGPKQKAAPQLPVIQ